LPATLRRILRKQLIIGDCSMDQVAAMLGIHRRTLDRHLQEHGVQYSELLESVQDDVARQLLRDTTLQVQHVAEALHFSSAANFATAFRRWTGMTPSEYRRRVR
jgi:AraC-like DNA-binding protein